MFLMRTLSSRVVPALALGCLIASLLDARPVHGQTLRGSRSSMDLQNRVAKAHDFTFIETPDRVRYFADQGWLVPVESTRDFVVKGDVSFPFARPEVELFAQRLGRQYRRACGEQLVVTSLTRPANRQPRNASDRSVHPTGMAIDIRYSWNESCRRWLEDVLASLERQGVLEATLERRPRHYHVAVFPSQYAQYVERLAARGDGGPGVEEYRVRSGDSLWNIARKHGTTVDELKEFNGIQGSQIFVGQLLDVPLGS
jgi:hypothetical protein